jgi:hypothetical protein
VISVLSISYIVELLEHDQISRYHNLKKVRLNKWRTSAMSTVIQFSIVII